MNKSLKVAYMSGGSEFTIEPLNALLKSKHKVVKIYTKQKSARHRARKQTKNFLIEIAKKNKLEIVMTNNFEKNDLIQDLKKTNPDFILVFAYGVLLPKEVLEIPKYGCINIHTSLLPKWRGASPIQHALLHNEEETGVVGADPGYFLPGCDETYSRRAQSRPAQNGGKSARIFSGP